jgi:hypothetical protein
MNLVGDLPPSRGKCQYELSFRVSVIEVFDVIVLFAPIVTILSTCLEEASCRFHRREV